MDRTQAESIFCEQVKTLDAIDYQESDRAYGSDQHTVDYSTGEYYTTAFFLQCPTDKEMTYAYNGNGSICRDEHGAQVGRWCILEIREHRTPCPDDDRCGDMGDCEWHCIVEPSSWDWEYHELDEPDSE